MKNPLLVTMRGPDNGELDLTKLSDFEAGYIVLKKLAQAYPGMTWGQLVALSERAPVTMSGWWTDFTEAVSAPVRNVGGLIGDAFREGGSYIGKGVRLFTDKKVVDGADRAYRGFTESGGVTGFWTGSDPFGFGGGEGGEAGGFQEWVKSFITNLGSGAKANQAGAFGLPAGVLPWAIAGGLALVFVFGKVERRGGSRG